MSTINLSPQSTLSRRKLSSTGSYSEVLLYTQNIYTSSQFISGAVDGVKLAYHFFVGNILDIELETSNIYIAYEQAVTKYGYFINAHQAQNVLYDLLGFATATFDQNGNITAGTDVSTKYPRFSLGYARTMAQAFGGEIGIGGVNNQYSASFDIQDGVQDYDLNEILNNSEFSGIVDGKKINIKDVYFKSRNAQWRFFGAFAGAYGGYGGYGSVGGYGVYSGYANSSMFHLYPAWQTKLEAMSYEDTMWTRTSHYSFQIINNKLRIFPIPSLSYDGNNKFWFTFQIENDPWTNESGSFNSGSTGAITNLNNLPLANIPYDSINSVGKQWIRNYFLVLVAEMLSFSRGKIDQIPIANGPVKLNSGELASWAAQEKEKLERELKEYLDKLAYPEITRRRKETVDDAMGILNGVPSLLYMK